jgi:acyl-coenzyme A synthetase/AMP-(fatty) acid ligase
MGCHGLGHCVILSKDIPPSPAEIKSMVTEYGLTVLFLFSSFLSKSLREARLDPELLRSLQSIPSVLHGGLALNPDDATWARANGLYLKDVFASTEVGLMMFGIGGSGPNAGYLQPPPGVTYRFTPASGSSIEDQKSRNIGPGEQLLELVVPSESRNCPHGSLRHKETGDFHTGDLFAEPIPGHFLSRGRNDDWIKMEISLRCDTKSIEGNVMELCGKDLVSTVVCLGTGRPSPALLVEPLQEKDGDDYSALKDEIVRRIRPFHERMYTHERIEDPRFIITCPKGSLPRTSKGGVPRTVVEKIFEKALDEIYGRK